MNKKIFYTMFLMGLTATAAFAGNNYNYTEPATTPQYQPNYYQQENFQIQNGTLKGSVVTVPAGQTFRSVVMTPLSSETMTLGQSVSLALGTDFYYNGHLIAPAGSTVNGSVLEVSKAKHGTLNGKLLIRFTQIVTPYGVQIPISAVIKTDDGKGVLVGGTKVDVAREYVKDTAVGAGAGALAGVVFGALAGGSIGQGAALGTAVGAGGGIVKSIWDKGIGVTIPANASIELVLTQPITVNPAINQSQF